MVFCLIPQVQVQRGQILQLIFRGLVVERELSALNHDGYDNTK